MAVDTAVRVDLLIMTVDARPSDARPDLDFAHAFGQWFIEHPTTEIPPALVVATGVDGPEFGEGWHPPYDWAAGRGPARPPSGPAFDAIRPGLPPSFSDIVPVGLNESHPFGVVEQLLPAIAALLQKAERTALIRRLHEMGGRSKVGRLVQQLGTQGKSLWSHLTIAPERPAGAILVAALRDRATEVNRHERCDDHPTPIRRRCRCIPVRSTRSR